MSYEKVKSITIKNNQVWINGKSNNDTEPYKIWHCSSLTEVLTEKGPEACEIEILKAFEEGQFQCNASISNKYTKALKVLRGMEEYKNFNWRNSNYDNNCPIQANRKSEKFREILKVALNTKVEEIKEQFIVTKDSAGDKYYLRKLLRGRASFSPSRQEAKIFTDREEMENRKKAFQSGETWVLEDINVEVKPKEPEPNIILPLNAILTRQLSIF